MKTNHVSTRAGKTVLAVAAVIAMFVCNPFTSQANGLPSHGHQDKTAPGLTDGQVSVQYTGSDNDNVTFSVKFENPLAEKFWFIVKNDAGDIIYRQQFSDLHFAKSIVLQKDDNVIQPSFIIRKGNAEIVHRFVVSRKFTENTTVTKL
jgi:hypothetical protein